MPGSVPTNPSLFHITHIDNLSGIVRAGCLWSDAQRLARGFSTTNIAYSHIKERRLKRSVPVGAKGCLGDYVPFNFCPRSVMLFVIHKGHAEYSGGQDQVVHLVSSVSSAAGTKRPFAFTDRHAYLDYARYFDSRNELKEVDWDVIPNPY